MKITTKTNKDTLVRALGDNALAIKKADKGLFDRIAYADKAWKKDPAKVTRKDLVDMVKEAITVLGEAFKEPELVPVGAENSVKKLAKGVAKKQETKPEVKEETPEEAPEELEVKEPEAKEEKVVEKKKTTAKKSTGAKKTTAPKKDDVATSTSGIVQKDIFPDTMKVGETNYELTHDIKSIDDLYSSLEKDEEIVFAYYWTKAHLKKFPYFYDMFGRPKSFDKDLDLATTIYVSEEKKIAYHISMYTEGCYNTMPDDFEEVDGIRYSGGIEFQIYRAVQ